MGDKIINYKGEDVLEAVHAINFGKGGILDISGEELTYDRDFCKAKPCKLCDECNECKPVITSGDDKYKFTNVSHGAHILDYIKAYNLNNKHEKISVESWSDYPVIFVMENPSTNRAKQYEQNGKNNEKFLPNRWYWGVKGYKECDEFILPEYPKYFKQGMYSELFLSIANTFKLKNAYLTNMVKCGIGSKVDGIEKAVNTSDYNNKIIETCINVMLVREIDALRTKDRKKVIIFAFGDNVYYNIKQNEKLFGDIDVYKLPHPANWLSNDYRKYVLLAKICQAFMQNNIPFDETAIKNLIIDDRQAEDNTETTDNAVINRLKEKLEEELNKNNWEKSDNYKIGINRYSIGKSRVVFKYRTDSKDRLEDGISRVIWIEYDFINSSYNVYTGKNDSANDRVETDFEKYSFYNEVKEIIDNVLKAE